MKMKMPIKGNLFIRKSVSPVYYDTGCTPTSYFKDKPMNLKNYEGSVKTASNQKVNARGVGEIKLGRITIDNVILFRNSTYEYGL